MNYRKPHLIFITGVDGAGKSCHAKWLKQYLTGKNYKTELVWSRFNNFFSKPLLALARLTGHNYYKTIDGVLFGFHKFKHLYLFKHFFALLQAIDVNIAVIKDISGVRKSSDIVIAERGPWDTLADVVSDTGLDVLCKNFIGRLYTLQVRFNTKVIYIDRSYENILDTRPELVHDPNLKNKIRIYRLLANQNKWEIVDNNGTFQQTREKILGKI